MLDIRRLKTSLTEVLSSVSVIEVQTYLGIEQAADEIEYSCPITAYYEKNVFF